MLALRPCRLDNVTDCAGQAPLRANMSSTKRTNQEIIDEIVRVASIIDRPPSYEDMRAHGKISPSAARRRFLSWRGALEAAGYEDPVSKWTVDLLTPEEGGWLAGFAAGEACFRIARPSPGSGNGLSRSYNCVFTIQLRADDIPALKMMQKLWQLDKPLCFWPRERDRARGIDAGDGARLSIRDIPNLYYKIIQTFRRYPLRTRKQSDFDIFSQAVQLLYIRMVENRSNLPYTSDERQKLDNYYWQLREVKKYVPIS